MQSRPCQLLNPPRCDSQGTKNTTPVYQRKTQRLPSRRGPPLARKRSACAPPWHRTAPGQKQKVAPSSVAGSQTPAASQAPSHRIRRKLAWQQQIDRLGRKRPVAKRKQRKTIWPHDALWRRSANWLVLHCSKPQISMRISASRGRGCALGSAASLLDACTPWQRGSRTALQLVHCSKAVTACIAGGTTSSVTSAPGGS